MSGDQQENKRPRVEGCLSIPLPELSTVIPTTEGQEAVAKKKPAILLSCVKNKQDVERVRGAQLALIIIIKFIKTNHTRILDMQ